MRNNFIANNYSKAQNVTVLSVVTKLLTRMSGQWLSSLLIVVVNWTMVNSKVDLDSPIRLAHCRATCVYKMNIPQLTNKLCEVTVNCSQCWETCRLLQEGRERQLHCSSRDCGMGCREACRFPLLSRTYSELRQYEEELVLSDTLVSWPRTADAAVYVVMGRRSGRPWAQLLQTLDYSATLPPDTELESVRVLEVQWRGLTKVYSPPPESPLAQVQAVLHSLGMEKRITSGMATPQTNVTSALQEPSVVSMTQQSGLVLTQICWRPSDSPLIYLVTWQLREGVLRGNLVTNSSCATISLWPDTVYRVQVAIIGPGTQGSQSGPLVVDTHLVHTESPGPLHSHVTSIRHSNLTPGPGTQAVVGFAAGVVVFLAVTLSLTWRWRHRLSLPHTKLVDEPVDTPNIYRVFPPAVRLIGDRQDMFSSTDNLLRCN